MRALGWAALACAALAAGCGFPDGFGLRPWANVEPSPRYAVLPGSSTQCQAAAKRATYYCEIRMAYTERLRYDDQPITDCNDAQRDFQRYCR